MPRLQEPGIATGWVAGDGTASFHRLARVAREAVAAFRSPPAPGL
ncbi:hypothetical protein GCM10011374_38920 [Kocuria dechangensis]|uniref:Uncharacterized protein n=1 Tax=Kocuria dechangensis TaxID=1176249 RepID=A0A917H7U8_9MICC|nr:hypothetical protein GCM10011374_38920 [Kocuria dechangensis]